MSVHLGGGWRLVHLTDRVLELRKDCPAYRRLTGKDGYVRLRAEPGMDRNGLIDKAVAMAKRNDEQVAVLVGKDLLPSTARVGRYHLRQRQMAPVFGVPGQEPERRVYRP